MVEVGLIVTALPTSLVLSDRLLGVYLSMPIASYDTKPTATEYTAFQAAYDSYNAALFSGQLPQCLITLQRRKGYAGYFWHGQFKARSSEARTDEIALNPEIFADLMEILQTLVHEMCHLWQAHFGKPSRNAYHNKEWAAKMREVGLIPSTTGQPGGKETGQRVGDYGDPAGLFAAHTATLIASGFMIQWRATSKAKLPTEPGATAELDDNDQLTPNPKNKIKYACTGCGQNAWAKPSARLICGDCEQSMSAR
ncbi:MAG: SprT-like domain-containing protein [Chloroflexota bacterium]|nr:SprT-like domain-containing protein [Chloroflexota bacterium]